MNARIFRQNVFFVIAFYSLVTSALVLSAVSGHQHFYCTLKDAIPLLIAIPAAWLGYCLQRRQTYLKDVRDLWSKLVVSVQDAIQYTHTENPPQSEFARVSRSLSITTEELRAVFLNIGEREGKPGLFPFEKIKVIQEIVSRLGFGEQVTPVLAKSARTEIVGHWKLLRAHFLTELARDIPARPDSPFIK
jgi:hypothetical protein